MKIIPIILACILTFSAKGQQKGVWALFASAELNNFQSVGGSFSFHPYLTPYLSIGGGIDLTRIKNLGGNTVPIYLDTRFWLPGKTYQPFVFLQGGYTGYNKIQNGIVNQTRTELQGRAFLGGGAGFSAAKEKARLKPFLAFKYRNYQVREVFIVPGNPSDVTVRNRSNIGQYTFSCGIRF